MWTSNYRNAYDGVIYKAYTTAIYLLRHHDNSSLISNNDSHYSTTICCVYFRFHCNKNKQQDTKNNAEL